MQLPEDLLVSLKDIAGFDSEAFKAVHASGEQVTSIRVNPAKLKTDGAAIEKLFSCNNAGSILKKDASFTDLAAGTPSTGYNNIPWSACGYYLPRRPSFTFDPLFHAGLYYVQEASSMFLEQALKQLVDLTQPLKILDLSAAPGGKSTHIQSLISDESLLVSNEVIRNRCVVLVDNIMKWGGNNTVVTNNDPAAFKKLPAYFDIIVVDAPCSGSGLFRKDPDAVNEWSLNNVALCSQRQQRILADVLPTLKKDGLLIYSTCSYSKEEDEEICDWLVDEFGLQNEKLKIEKHWGIIETASRKTGAVGYRFYPYLIKGEGLFLSCFRKTKEEDEFQFRPFKIEKASAKEKELLQPYIESTEPVFLKENNRFLVLPVSLVNDYAVLKNVLNVQYGGTVLGEIMKNKLIPHHSIALSINIADTVTDSELSYENAIKFLQRGNMTVQPVTLGWQTVSHKKHRLGWINALPNRINNYYPKELRILKQSI